MPSMRPNESDDDSELSDVNMAEIESVALLEAPESTAHQIPSSSPEVDKMNEDQSQTVSVSPNTGPNADSIDLDTQPPSEEEGFMTASESPKNNRLLIKSIGHRPEKSSTETEPVNDRPETPFNPLKRKKFPSESPNKAFTSPAAHRPHPRPDLATPTQHPAAFPVRQSMAHRSSSVHHSSTSGSRKIEQETALLREALFHVSTEATQAILREQWRDFLFTDAEDQHITFILRAGLKNANANSLARVFRDSGVMKDTLVEAISGKQPVVARVLKSASANQIADLVPSNILDQALAERLKSVPAKTLIRWLAEADRLGYSLDDILDETDETVMPMIPSPAQSYDGDINMAYDQPRNPEPPSLDPLMAEQQRIIEFQKARFEAQQHSNSELRCPTCTYKFDTIRGYNFHRSKHICTKAQPPGLKFYCGNCAQGFTTKQGMLYHEKKRVCLGEEGEDDVEVALYQDHNDRMAGFEPFMSNSPHAQNLSNLNTSLHAEMYPHNPHSPNNPVPTWNIPRPPLHTPEVPKQITSIIAASPMDDGARHSPSELTPEKRAALNSALQRIEDKYAADQAAIPDDWPAEKREARLISLKNGTASRKSQIRKQFGVTLRMRDKDKEAKKRREVLGSLNSPAPPARPGQFEDFRNPSTTPYPMSAQEMHHRQPPPGTRMEMVDMRPASSFSPINAAQNYANSHPQALPGQQMLPYSVPPNTKGFLPSFPPAARLMSHALPGPHTSPYGCGSIPPRQSYGEDHANKIMKGNSNVGINREEEQEEEEEEEEEERSRHFAHSDSASINMRARSSSGSQMPLIERMKGNNGASRPSSSGSSGMGGSRNGNANADGNAVRPGKKVPVIGLQRTWEAINGKEGRRELEEGEGSRVMLSVEGNGNERAREENGNVAMDKDNGEGVQPAGGRAIKVIDLVSEDESSGANANGSGDER